MNFLKPLRAMVAGLTLVALAAQGAGAQQPGNSRSDLEHRRQSILADIQASQAQLESTKRDKNATLAQLSALQAKLDARQRLIGNINSEIDGLSTSIVYSQQEIDRLNTNLEALKVRYAQSVRYAYRNRSSYSTLAFLLSSQGFDDALRRMKYMKRFRDYRAHQADEIRFTKSRIADRIGVLNTEKSRKDLLRVAEERQRQVLQDERNETNAVAVQLRGKEKELMTDIQKKQKNAAQIKKTIDDIIRREIAAAKKKADEEAEARRIAAARKKAADDEAKRVAANAAAAKAAAARTAAARNNNSSGVSVATGSGARPAMGPKPENIAPPPANPTPPVASGSNYATPPPATNPNPAAGRPAVRRTSADPTRDLTDAPEVSTLSLGFANNRGRLPWPVERGAIISSFGKHQHPLFPKVTLQNDGIDIQTAPGAAVRAVYDGVVSAVYFIPGVGSGVIVRHGDYFTVYTGLASASVAKNQEIKAKQTLGVVGMNEDNIPLLKFEVHKGIAAMNPEGWIAR